MTIHRRLIEKIYPRTDRCATCHSRLHIVKPDDSGVWNHADWGRIVFNDESRLQLCPDDHRRRVWKCLGQCADPSFTIARHTGPQPGVMVWGVISFDIRTPLVVIRGPFRVQWYAEDILKTVLLLFFLQYPGLIFQQDNARPHTARVAINCLTAC
ncbi:transposable element Tc1 transposase [Trichonephila clavipes]|nr:transposable element Tc1 transposase [Trichonephila clavipes]